MYWLILPHGFKKTTQLMTKKLRQFFNFSRQGKVWYFKARAFVGAYKTGLFLFFF